MPDWRQNRASGARHAGYHRISDHDEVATVVFQQQNFQFISYGPDGTLPDPFERGTILPYLIEKSGMFPGLIAADNYRVTRWLMFQTGGTGLTLGQLGTFQ